MRILNEHFGFNAVASLIPKPPYTQHIPLIWWYERLWNSRAEVLPASQPSLHHTSVTPQSHSQCCQMVQSKFLEILTQILSRHLWNFGSFYQGTIIIFFHIHGTYCISCVIWRWIWGKHIHFIEKHTGFTLRTHMVRVTEDNHDFNETYLKKKSIRYGFMDFIWSHQQNFSRSSEENMEFH